MPPPITSTAAVSTPGHHNVAEFPLPPEHHTGAETRIATGDKSGFEGEAALLATPKPPISSHDAAKESNLPSRGLPGPASFEGRICRAFPVSTGILDPLRSPEMGSFLRSWRQISRRSLGGLGALLLGLRIEDEDIRDALRYVAEAVRERELPFRRRLAGSRSPSSHPLGSACEGGMGVVVMRVAQANAAARSVVRVPVWSARKRSPATPATEVVGAFETSPENVL
jgi:hypothetical protein